MKKKAKLLTQAHVPFFQKATCNGVQVVSAETAVLTLETVMKSIFSCFPLEPAVDG